MDRDELIAELLAGYKQELASLSEKELLDHWKLQKGVSQMTDEQWAEIYKNVGQTR
jgi:hypothetical protein